MKYNALLIGRKNNVEGILFECDKQRNQECKKTHCGTYCNHTSQIKYARETNNTKYISMNCDINMTEAEKLIEDIKELCIKNNIQPSIKGTEITIDVMDKVKIEIKKK